MAEQIFNVNCGFFDAIDNDRRYSADEMTMPYKRVVANGVFATQQGTPSTDLQTVSADSGMDIIVKRGNGIIGDKWFESAVDIRITVPDNNGITNRVDSVIAQVDARSSGRVGNIVYRTGSATAPPINETSGVYEFRVANVTVEPGAVEIGNSAITDCRGSDDCPWVTSLIQQVDTSTLYQQWQAAYSDYFSATTEMIAAYMAEQSQAWQDFFDHATQSFTVVTYFKFTSQFITTAVSTTTVPINIPSYNKDTDILCVYINGLMAAENIRFTVNAAGTAITLSSSLPEGQTVYFEVLHAILPTDIDNAVTLINQLRNNDIIPMQGEISEMQGDITTLQGDVTTLKSDTGWVTATLEGTHSAASGLTPAYRKTDNRVYIRGAITAANIEIGSTIFTLPAGMRPSMNHYYMSGNCLFNAGNQNTLLIEISTSGAVSIINGTITSQSAVSTRTVPLATDFLIG